MDVDPAVVIAYSTKVVLDGNGVPLPVPGEPLQQHVLNIPAEVLTSIGQAVREREVAPAVLKPGDEGAALCPDGSLLTIGINGEVYRDAEQLPGIFARQVVRFGVHVYAQGKTTPLWWRWTGNGWAVVAGYDSRVLAELPAP